MSEVYRRFCSFFFIAAICLLSCGENTKCSVYSSENYVDERIDSTELSQLEEYRDLLLERFHETPIRRQNYEVYHLMFYSVHGFGKSVKFEKDRGVCSVRVKCILNEDWYPCRNYQVQISEQEWKTFQKMIFDFNFWTEKQFDIRKDVLDGHAYLLEGNRPDAGQCSKRIYHSIGRRSPEYDKIGALCQYILRYEADLAEKYAVSASPH